MKAHSRRPLGTERESDSQRTGAPGRSRKHQKSRDCQVVPLGVTVSAHRRPSTRSEVPAEAGAICNFCMTGGPHAGRMLNARAKLMAPVVGGRVLGEDG